MSCAPCCFPDWICQCVPYGNLILFNSNSLDENIYFKITDKFDNVYSGKLEMDDDSGKPGINTNLLPDGLFVAPNGDLIIEFYQDVDLVTKFFPKFTRAYECVTLSVKAGNTQKDTIGEE